MLSQNQIQLITNSFSQLTTDTNFVEMSSLNFSVSTNNSFNYKGKTIKALTNLYSGKRVLLFQDTNTKQYYAVSEEFNPTLSERSFTRKYIANTPPTLATQFLTAYILRYRFPMLPPPKPVVNIQYQDVSDYDYYLYRGDGSVPFKIPVNKEWSLVASDLITIPPQTRVQKTLADYGLTIASYSSAGAEVPGSTGAAGLSPWANVWVWQKSWRNTESEASSPWGKNFYRVRSGAEGSIDLGTTNTLLSQTVYIQVQIFVSDIQHIYMSLNKNKMYLYNAIGSRVENDRHGIFYYQLPYYAKSLTSEPTRFSTYPGFVGAQDDWMREWPDIATLDPVPENNLSNFCFYMRYGSSFYNYSNSYEYYAFLGDGSVNKDSDITVIKTKIVENNSETCTLSSSNKEFKLRYKKPIWDLPDNDVSFEYIMVAQR